MFYAYVHAKPIEDDNYAIFYVGKGQGKRSHVMSGRGQWHEHVVGKHGRDAILIGRFECSEEQTAYDLEIGLLKCLRRAKAPLVNVIEAGGKAGYVLPQEAREKIAASKRGKPRSEETKRKVSESKKGRPGTPHTEETKAYLSACFKGKPGHARTEETRRKISAKLTGLKRAPEFGEAVRLRKMGTKHTPESIAKMSASKTGKPRSLEAIEKTRQKILGIKRSEETRRKMSEAQKARFSARQDPKDDT